MPRPGGTQGGGLEGDQLAGSCFHAFRNAMIGMGAAIDPWDGLDESYQAGFVAAAKYAEDFLAGEEVERGTWRSLGLNCMWQFCRAAGETPPIADLIPPDTALAWEAFARHASNMMDFDADEGAYGLESHESYWTEWAAAKKAAASMPQQLAEAQRPIEEDS